MTDFTPCSTCKFVIPVSSQCKAPECSSVVTNWYTGVNETVYLGIGQARTDVNLCGPTARLCRASRRPSCAGE